MTPTQRGEARVRGIDNAHDSLDILEWRKLRGTIYGMRFTNKVVYCNYRSIMVASTATGSPFTTMSGLTSIS